MDHPLIAIDGHRLLDEPLTSGATYLRSLLKEWQELPSPPQVVLCLPRQLSEVPDPVLQAPNVRLAVPKAPVTPTARFRAQCAWQQLTIPHLLRQHRPAVYFSPFHQTPQLPLRLPMVAAIHDLCFLSEPALSLSATIHRLQVLTACLRARRLICVSRFTAAALQQWWPRASRKATVVYNGFLNGPIPRSEAEQLLSELGNGIRSGEYFLWIGNPNWRKNPEGILDSFALYRKQNASAQRLVVVAPEHTHSRLRDMAHERGVVSAVVFLARVKDAVRDALYACATALVFPSRCEGFAYPVLEALVQGCPVVSYRHSPAYEIIANAFPLAATLEPGRIAALMAQAAALTPTEREAARTQLVARTRHFTTKAMAQDTLQVLLEAARY